MIHEIAPHKLNNEFKTIEPKPTDYLIIFNGEQTLFKKAIHIEGGTLEQPVPIHVTGCNYNSETFIKSHLHDTFNEWREMCWEELQSITRQLDAMNISPAQREYYRLVFEQFVTACASPTRQNWKLSASSLPNTTLMRPNWHSTAVVAAFMFAKKWITYKLIVLKIRH